MKDQEKKKDTFNYLRHRVGSEEYAEKLSEEDKEYLRNHPKLF